MNDFFSNVVSNLNILQYEDPTVDIDHFEEPSPKANENYINHPSIRAIKENNKDKITKKIGVNLDSINAI